MSSTGLLHAAARPHAARPQRTPLDAWVARRLGTGAAPGREELERRQLALLGETLARVRERSPLYRERLQGCGEVASLEQLGALPFTTADDLRQRGAELLCVPQGEVERVVTLQSSGTTGLPKRLFFTADEQEATVDFFAHGMSTLVGPSDRVLLLLPGATSGSAGALLAVALRRLGATPVPHGFVRGLQEATELLLESRATSLVAAPVQALALARYGAATQQRAALRTALLTTDHVPRSVVAELRRLWGCEVFEHYGMTEMALGGAVECAAHRGCHAREADLLFEIVDPVTGRPLPRGAPGEVVFTTLTRRAMPLVRYRTGDLSRIQPGRCPCGSELLRLGRVRARVSAPRLSRGVVLADLDERIFALPGVLDFSAAVVHSRGGRTRLSILLRTLCGAGERGAERVLEALDGIGPLRESRLAGALQIDVAEERGPALLSTGACKRALAVAPAA